MADQQKTQKKIAEKKVKAGMAKASEPAAGEIVPPPAAPATVTPANKSMKKGKLLPKNKHRLPRRQKKARQKAATHL
ncbi:MAG TPA: hypothetical protein VEV17_27105 [Bryobacteraceae bacterium]|nr:hypothetical protein [Bryobacteraceae bacterium]